MTKSVILKKIIETLLLPQKKINTVKKIHSIFLCKKIKYLSRKQDEQDD